MIEFANNLSPAKSDRMLPPLDHVSLYQETKCVKPPFPSARGSTLSNNLLPQSHLREGRNGS